MTTPKHLAPCDHDECGIIKCSHAKEPPSSGSERRLVRLAPITETITAEAGWIIDWWTAKRHCPECGKHGRERAGAEFQHMDRCVDCGHVWTPETWYLRIRQPNDPEHATRPADGGPNSKTN